MCCGDFPNRIIKKLTVNYKNYINIKIFIFPFYNWKYIKNGIKVRYIWLYQNKIWIKLRLYIKINFYYYLNYIYKMNLSKQQEDAPIIQKGIPLTK